nr:chemotaxis protein CheB [Variovorax boronicumulans]
MDPSRGGTGDETEASWAVAIGASTGGLAPLVALIAQLPVNFPAPVLVVQHIGPYRSGLARRLTAEGVLSARDACDGEPLRPGVVYVAPADAPLLAGKQRLRLSHGPRVNHTRPAIDPLLRTCALAHGPRAIGVVLSGRMDAQAALQAGREAHAARHQADGLVRLIEREESGGGRPE